MDSPFPPGSALACYLRDSGGVSQDLSVDQQLTVIREWCDNNDYTLSSVFADRARPGGTVTGRVEFDRLIRHFQAGAPEAGVVFWDLSRWARSFDDGQFYLSALRRLGYQVHSLEQYIPPGSIGRVVESLHLWSAEEFRKQLSHNIKRGLRYIVTVHHAYPMPHTPVGYRKEPSQIGIRRNGEPHLVNRLVPDPATRAAVLRAFELRASRQSIAEVHALINLFPSRTGYQHMFRNEIYRGVFVYGDLRVDDFCEAIIPGELWRSVQEVNREWADWRRDSMTATHPRRVGSPYLLSGLVRCAHCGRAMAGHTTTTKSGPYRYYICTSHTNTTTDDCAALQIRAADLESAVLRLALDFVSDEAVLQSLVEAVRLELSTRPDDAAANLQRIQADVRNCEQAIDNLLRTLEMTGTSRAIADRLRALEQQRGDLAERLGEAQRAIDARRGFDPQTAEASAAGARLSLGQVDARQRQLALRSIIREIRATRSGASTVIFSLPGLGIDTPAEFRL